MLSEVQARAESHARRVLDALDYVGVLAIELFQVGDRLLANEMAPRVHNSGHWTIEGAETSQFENHLRAVAGLPLGSTAPRGVSAMLNLIGALPDGSTVLAIPGATCTSTARPRAPGGSSATSRCERTTRRGSTGFAPGLAPLIPPDPTEGA